MSESTSIFNKKQNHMFYDKTRSAKNLNRAGRSIPAALSLSLNTRNVIYTNKNNILMVGGRVAGKTDLAHILSLLLMLNYPYSDGICGRVSYGSMADSCFAEMQSLIEGLDILKGEFTYRKQPLRIERRNDAGTMYFIGYGGADTDRTKGLKTKHKVKFVILEETQQLKSKRNYDEAMASFRRNFGANVKVFILGNPPPQEAHWFNVFVRECMNDPDWLVQEMSYLDIIPFLNDYDLREILKTKINNPEYYKWFYLGQTTGGFGSVYPMYRKDKYVITPQAFDLIKDRLNLKVVGCVIGADGAVNNDKTAFTPLILLNNGQAIIGPVFCHDPTKDSVIGYHQLVKDHVVRWFNDLCKRFHLGTREEQRINPYTQLVPIYMRIDSAAPDLVQECRFYFGDRINVAPIRKSTILEMVGVMQSAICNNQFFTIDYGGHYDYYKNTFVKDSVDLISYELTALIWNDKQNGYDPIVPNDIADSLTYAVLFWYGNNENIHYFDIVKQNGLQNVFIQDNI